MGEIVFVRPNVEVGTVLCKALHQSAHMASTGLGLGVDGAVLEDMSIFPQMAVGVVLEQIVRMGDALELGDNADVQLFGVQDAFTVAPATLVGFTDMFIPALLIAGTEVAVKTKFIIGVLSLCRLFI